MTELRATAALVGLCILLFGVSWLAHPGPPEIHPAVPDSVQDQGYLGSSACAACHPGEYASFHRTYHRSMTRLVRELSFDGNASPALPVSLELFDREFQLRKVEGRVEYRGPDLHVVGRELSRIARISDASSSWKREKSLAAFSSAPEALGELVLVTGSHHYLAFWIAGKETDELRQLPFVYLLDEARLLPREDAFLQPPDSLPHVARWNANCIQCHAVGGQPRQSEGTAEDGSFWEIYQTRVAENGISCEACHGPGERHAQAYRSPLARLMARSHDEAKHIFVPRPESGARGSAACGQCHSYFLPKDPDTWWESGFSASFRAGDSLESSRTILRLDAGTEEERAAISAIGRDPSTIFWSDGSILVGGREYNGLTTSACFLKGEGSRKLSCTHCHSMHDSDPDKQLTRERPGNALCTSCHAGMTGEHTRHAPASIGSRCVSCHMPRTSYALLHGVASHHIASPHLEPGGPPNACALCHVDRTRAWLETNLLPPSDAEADLDGADAGLPYAAERALSGNAAERALFAYALGTPEALETAGPTVARLILPRLEHDPYAAVRLIAARSKRNLPTLAPSFKDEKLASSLSQATLDRLQELRDETPIVISE